MVTNRVLGQASPLKEVVIGEEGATGMLEIPYDKTALVGYIEKVRIRQLPYVLNSRLIPMFLLEAVR